VNLVSPCCYTTNIRSICNQLLEYDPTRSYDLNRLSTLPLVEIVLTLLLFLHQFLGPFFVYRVHFFLLYFSLLSIAISPHVCFSTDLTRYSIWFLYRKVCKQNVWEGFPVTSGLFRRCRVWTILSTSVGHSGFFRNFFTDIMYKQFQIPVWGIPVSSGIFRRHNVWIISSTSVGLSGIFCTHNVWNNQCGALQVLQEIFAYATYEPLFSDNTGARSGFPQQCSYAQACPSSNTTGYIAAMGNNHQLIGTCYILEWYT